MIYKFLVGSEESPSFKLEIVIDSSDTFMRLRNVILDAAGYDKGQMDSFYICNEEWHKEKEVTYVDMGVGDDEDIWLMEDTVLDELLDDEGQRLLFVFDYMNERNFFMVLKEIIPKKHLHDPLCQRKEGRPPKEVSNELLAEKTVKVETPSIDDLDAEFYGEESFNAEDIADLGELDTVSDL